MIIPHAFQAWKMLNEYKNVTVHDTMYLHFKSCITCDGGLKNPTRSPQESPQKKSVKLWSSNEIFY